MAVFISLETDPFEANYARLKSRNDPSVSRSGRAGLSNVRRPLRGMEIKQDTYASLKVIRSDGSEVPFLDSSAATGSSTSYSNFILQSVQETRMEKHQIIETFGDTYLYFFGESPRFIDVQAVLLNSFDFNWQAEWWANWDATLRGSKSVENGARTYLFYDDSVIEGYMLMSQATVVSTEPFMVSMSFRMFVSSYRNVSFVGDPNFPVSDAVNLPPDISLTSGDAYSQITALYNTDSSNQDLQSSLANDPAYTSTPDTFGAAGNLVDALQQGARAAAFPSSVQATIDSMVASNTGDLDTTSLLTQLITRPLRSLISDNTDEYTGSGGTAVDYLQGQLPEVYDPRVRSQVEVDDLFHSAISWMACFGADINGYDQLSDLGMGISFSPGSGIGIGLGTGLSSGATFSPISLPGVGYGGSAGQGFGFGAPGGIGFSGGSYAGPGTYGSAGSISALNSNPYGTGNLAAQQFASAQQGDSSNSIFSAGAGVASDGSSYSYSSLDPDSGGYPSPYGGPGFGQAGFGDYGGPNFGSSHGASGDPGFLPTSQFSFAGVPDTNGALERLMSPNVGYGSGFGGVGAGDSYSSTGAGPSISVGGAVTAFSVAAVPGQLDPSGMSLGNPYGVSCSNNAPGAPTNLLSML